MGNTNARTRRAESFASRPSSNRSTPVDKPHSTILLLGCGEAGKTTVCTRWRLWMEKAEEKRSVLTWREGDFITQTLRSYFSKLVDAIIAEELDLQDKAANEVVEHFSELMAGLVIPLPKETGMKLKLLWKNPVFQAKFKADYSNTEVETSLNFFFEDFERFYTKRKSSLSFEDLLYCRIATSGIISQQFYTVGRRNIQILDAAGQRSERRKWKKRYRCTDVVVYVASLAGFDQMMFEDGNTNRLSESLKNFESVVNDPELAETKFVLLFTKLDLFEKKIKVLKEGGEKVSEAFPKEFSDSINDDMSSEDISQVIVSKFMQKGNENVELCLKVNLLDTEDTVLFKEIYRVLENIDIYNSFSLKV